MTNLKQVIFICETCTHINKMRLGEKGFIPYQVEFESLTDTWKHLINTNANRNDIAHEMIAVVREDNVQ